jgi:hypothetical protein
MPASYLGDFYFAWTDTRNGNMDIYAQRLNGAGVSQWTADGLAIAATGFQEYQPSAAGSTGFYISWIAESMELRLQKLDASGTPLFAPAGMLIDTSVEAALHTAGIVRDTNSGGVFAVLDRYTDVLEFDELRIFAQKVWPNGSTWGPTPVMVIGQSSYEHVPTDFIADGIGAVVIAWMETDASDVLSDVFVQRQSLTPFWESGGVALSSAPGHQILPRLVRALGSYLTVWQDSRSVPPRVFAQRVTADGLPGAPEPCITGIADVPGDQGGRAQILWSGSVLDRAPSWTIGSYTLWRLVTPAAAMLALGQGAALVTSGAEPAGGRAIRLVSSPLGTDYWEFIESLPARGVVGYGYTAPTSGDSTGSGIPYDRFFVDAKEANSNVFYLSPVDSGYSVDNLAPFAPIVFGGSWSDNTVHLNWSPSTDLDFDTYRLYRGPDADFTPSPENLIAELTQTVYEDPNPQDLNYKLSAVDVNGNEGVPAVLLSLQIAGAPHEPVGVPFVLGLATPNPFRRHTRLTIYVGRSTVIHGGVFDAHGRLVRKLGDLSYPAGRHTVTWDGRDDRGRPAPGGLYYVKVAATGATWVSSVVLLN